MNYLCLAAGKGTRMGSLGSYLQKCMYPVNLRPFVEYSLRNLLATADVTNDQITFIVGHHQEQLRRYFGEVFEGLKINYLEQPEQLGTAHAIYTAHEHMHFTSPIVIWLADLYVPSTLFAEAIKHPWDNLQTLAPGHEDEKDNLKATVDRSGKVASVTKAWCGQDDLYDIGLWKLSPDVLDMMLSRREGEYRVLPNLQHAIDHGQQIAAVVADEWIHLGGVTPTAEENVHQVVKRLNELHPPHHQQLGQLA
ncbi:MAG: NTP transferase domain-containing protein [Deinococcota bacterium]